MRSIVSPADMAAAVLPRPLVGSCVTIGNFDGVHVGHRTLIGTMLDRARQGGLPGVVVTFWPHPLAVLASAHAPALITGQQERCQLLEALEVDVLLELPFDRTLAALSPEDFVRAVLLPLECRQLIIGYDFSLGKGRTGHREVLEGLGGSYNFTVEQLAPVIVQDAVVSSTRVRDLVRAGNVWDLRAVLGRFYSISGTVEHGFARGTALGFPTANVCVRHALLPRTGVYATWITRKDGARWRGVTNVGFAPTFGNTQVSVESFLLDACEDLYHQELEVHFVQRLRDEQRFENVDALKACIARDVQWARGILEESWG